MVLRIAEDEPGFPIADHFAAPCIGAGEDWKPASHGLQYRQIEAVLKRGSHIKVGGRKELDNVRRKFQEAGYALQIKFFQNAMIESGIDAPHNHQPQG